MKMTFEQVENGFVVTNEDGKKWIAIENEYASRYDLTLERVLRSVMKPEVEPVQVEEPSYVASELA